MSQPAAALYIQPPMFETIVATQSIANIRYRNGSSGDAPVERAEHAYIVERSGLIVTELKTIIRQRCLNDSRAAAVAIYNGWLFEQTSATTPTEPQAPSARREAPDIGVCIPFARASNARGGMTLQAAESLPSAYAGAADTDGNAVDDTDGAAVDDTAWDSPETPRVGDARGADTEPEIDIRPVSVDP